MREAQKDLAGLAMLSRLDDFDAVRAQWRRSIATLASLATESRQPVPLEGLNPDSLLASTKVALDHKLIDDLDWLSPPAAALAIFELASALPRSNEKRELGRRVLRSLHDGDAETFATVATALAQGSRRALSGAQIRGRVALSLELPIGMASSVDALALALISRRELANEWLAIPSTGSLPSRRLAARLLERAAREAARRAQGGNDAGVRVFDTEVVRSAWRRLFDDRESLAWRHVASARGLLSLVVPEMAEEVEKGLSPRLGPTEWRRAAASLAASIAVDPSCAERCRQLLDDPIMKKDRGLAGAMILGMPCAVDGDVDAVEELLVALVDHGGVYACEALVDLQRERLGEDIGTDAALAAMAQLEPEESSTDHGRVALATALRGELMPGHDPDGLFERLAAALTAFATGGAEAAGGSTGRALSAAVELVETLDKCEPDSPQAFNCLRDLDRGLLETATLSNLLIITGSETNATALSDLNEVITSWLLVRERDPVPEGELEHPTLRIRRLRSLLHLVDADGPPAVAASPSVRMRRIDVLRALLGRIHYEREPVLRRVLCASLARVLDALVREELCELSDVIAAVGGDVESASDLKIIAEASLDPELETVLRAYASLAEALEEKASPSVCVSKLRDMVASLPPTSSARVEAVRSALLELTRALGAVVHARSLSELQSDSDYSPLGRLESACHWLAQLVAGARRRLDLADLDSAPMSGTVVRQVEIALDSVVDGELAGIVDALGNAIAVLYEEIPKAFSDVICGCLQKVAALPLERDDDDTGDFDEDIILLEERVAPWLPPSRTLGGFYLFNSLGRGAVGSVFVACRSEDRDDENAERFALKVPEYSGAHAHTLSEAEFHDMFREEAGALLSLPNHPNIARFVTFDAGTKPKPILVMELVAGASLERLLDKEELTMAQAFQILDGIGKGLHAMHSAGVAHLDVKPSNIIMRGEDAVLVDFGLAGRNLRPGCATVYYGAPEVWTPKMLPGDYRPLPTDVYAYACLAYELVCGEPLFWGDTAVAITVKHLKHGGKPAALMQLAEDDPQLTDLVKAIARGLAQHAADRCTVEEMRVALSEIAPKLAHLEWPLRPRRRQRGAKLTA